MQIIWGEEVAEINTWIAKYVDLKRLERSREGSAHVCANPSGILLCCFVTGSRGELRAGWEPLQGGEAGAGAQPHLAPLTWETLKAGPDGRIHTLLYTK